MTPEEMDRKIAEFCGWKCVDVYEWDMSTFPETKCPKQFHVEDGEAVGLPKFSTDLNAMHEAEKTLTTHNQLHAYRMELGLDVSANAVKRAQAFLRTIGKWRDA